MLLTLRCGIYDTGYQGEEWAWPIILHPPLGNGLAHFGYLQVIIACWVGWYDLIISIRELNTVYGGAQSECQGDKGWTGDGNFCVNLEGIWGYK